MCSSWETQCNDWNTCRLPYAYKSIVRTLNRFHSCATCQTYHICIVGSSPLLPFTRFGIWVVAILAHCSRKNMRKQYWIPVDLCRHPASHTNQLSRPVVFNNSQGFAFIWTFLFSCWLEGASNVLTQWESFSSNPYVVRISLYYRVWCGSKEAFKRLMQYY